MEEDIKNIEEMLEFKEDIIKYHAWVGTKLINSVENLLTRYKEMEADNKRLKDKETEKFLKILDDTSKATLVQETIKLRTQVKDSIPKSELKNDLKHMKNAKATGVKQLLMKKGIIGYLEKLLS